MKPEHRAEVAERAARATPGPWVADIQENGIGMHVSSTAPNAGRDFPDLVLAGDEHGLVANWDDVRFAAAARTDVPALLADVDAAIARAEAAEGRLAAMQALVDAAVEREARVKQLREERAAAIARADLAEAEAARQARADLATVAAVVARAESAEAETRTVERILADAELAALREQIARMEVEARPLRAWYLPDGTFVELNPAEVVRRRKAAAVELANLRQELDLATFLAAARREALEAVREPFAATYPDSPVLAQMDAAIGSAAGRQWAHLVVKRRETAELLELARRWIWRAVDQDGYELHDQPWMAEHHDTTCECARVAEANRILHGWIP
jgi:hypothetical protein